MSSVREIAERLRKLRKAEPIVTPDGTVYVRGLSGAERQSYMETFSARTGIDRLPADQHLVAVGLCDEKAIAVFENFDDAFAVVQDWPIDVVTEGAKAICRLSGLSAASEDEAEKK